MLKKVGLGFGSVASIIVCGGCNPVAFFSLASDVTSTIINTGVIVGSLGVLANLGNITQIIQGLFGG